MSEICKQHRDAVWNDAATHTNAMQGCPYCQIDALKAERERYKAALYYLSRNYNSHTPDEVGEYASQALEVENV